VPCKSSRQQLGQADLSSVCAERPDVLDRLVDLRLPAMNLRHQSGNGAAMTGDDNRFAALHGIEKPRQVGLGFGGLNFAHEIL
jgi:hypothetical protein